MTHAHGQQQTPQRNATRSTSPPFPRKTPLSLRHPSSGSTAVPLPITGASSQSASFSSAFSSPIAMSPPPSAAQTSSSTLGTPLGDSVVPSLFISPHRIPRPGQARMAII
ncbi:hypothetical protein A4X06_0g3683 [Tilletia controversa]|uniref:Uncharacterized protein n=2 Tax=Tilletia TaxID=13289 RepID=A0A8X7MUX7_9BASI|nr:hypothetical protein CF336_g3275 [Tilletia laevis]KAE8248483.1 hypothetical protein A4X06_0g3683 [Tilletia controversa]KAE8249302.1 hypothetical protein A4X03_0g6631 [Tilletia caries]